jgi:hypothetical protein
MISLASVCYGDSRVAKHFLSPQHLILSGWQQTEFHWWLLPPVCFFSGHRWDTYNGLPYLDSPLWPHSCRNVVPLRYECLLQWEQNRSKATIWLLYKIPAVWGLPKTLLVDWQLCVACCYPKTHTDYPSTTRGTSVGPPVTINIDFCGYLRFLSISFVWSVWVPYATDNLSGRQFLFAS